jgi:hypothetical protein
MNGWARAVSVLLSSLALLCAMGGSAVAARPICELEALVTLAAEPAPAPPPAPSPSRGRACVPGVSDDAGCWPESPAAPLPVFATLGGTDASITIAAPPLPRPSSASFRFAPLAAGLLTPGHGRRIERPPRPFVV